MKPLGTGGYVIALLLLAGASPATLTTEHYIFPPISASVPDGNAVGLVDYQNLASDIVDITSLTIDLTLSGQFNGDLYAYLQHDTGVAILLNRPGKAAGSPFGYDDTAGYGLAVTLDDAAVAGDIHTYAASVIPPPGTPLTGIWQPDGRTTDPGLVDTADLRPARLNSFNGLDASGAWTLFVADLSAGSTTTLESWALHVEGNVIPEPGTWILLLLGLVAVRRIRKRPT